MTAPVSIQNEQKFHFRIDIQTEHFEVSTAEENGEKEQFLYNYTYAQNEDKFYFPYWAVQFIRVIKFTENLHRFSSLGHQRN